MKEHQETEMRCRTCGEKVLIGDGMYYCECFEIGLAYVDQGALDFPKFWVNEEAEGGEE